MNLTKSQLRKLIKEEIQLGKVYTFKDKPPFKTNEEQLSEGIPSAKLLEKDINKWYTMASNIFPDIEKTFKAAIKKKGIKDDKIFLKYLKEAVKHADLSFKQLDRIVTFMKDEGL